MHGQLSDGAALGGVWSAPTVRAIVTAFAEKDPDPAASFRTTKPSLADALAVVDANGPATWCSNPYLELGAHNAKTNCIGCHQHGGTDATTQAILATPALFPDNSRAKVRKNFPTDYVFTTSAGLELASSMRDTMMGLTPP